MNVSDRTVPLNMMVIDQESVVAAGNRIAQQVGWLVLVGLACFALLYLMTKKLDVMLEAMGGVK